jgi:hypothetical protein
MVLRPNDAAVRALCEQAGLPAPVKRRTIQTWALSHVERIVLRGGGTIICKAARAPFTAEAETLRALAGTQVPVPLVVAGTIADGELLMLLEDLGEPEKVAVDRDGVIAAVRLHQTGVEHSGLARFDTATLAALPQVARDSGRLHLGKSVLRMLEDLASAGRRLSRGAEIPPFGLSHGELHPSSVHLTSSCWHLLDYGMAFVGPGLLDLATWQGTRHRPDVNRLTRQMEIYVAVGGTAYIRCRRGGLPASIWALGWHRLHSAAWLLDLIVEGSDAFADADRIVARQIAGAHQLLL